MFDFFKKKAEVLEHWIGFAEDFQFSPAEFYTAVEKELQARQVPGLEMSRMDFAEGGLRLRFEGPKDESQLSGWFVGGLWLRRGWKSDHLHQSHRVGADHHL